MLLVYSVARKLHIFICHVYVIMTFFFKKTRTSCEKLNKTKQEIKIERI